MPRGLCPEQAKDVLSTSAARSPPAAPRNPRLLCKRLLSEAQRGALIQPWELALPNPWEPKDSVESHYMQGEPRGNNSECGQTGILSLRKKEGTAGSLVAALWWSTLVVKDVCDNLWFSDHSWETFVAMSRCLFCA